MRCDAMLRLKSVNTYILFSTIFFICFNFFYNPVKANESSTKKIFYLKDNGGNNGSLFTYNELFYPSKKLTKEFYIANNKSLDYSLKEVKLDNKLYGKDREVLRKDSIEYKNFISNVSIKLYCESKLLFSVSLEDILLGNYKINYYTEIQTDNMKKFLIEYALDEQADNTTMGIEHKFNIIFNFSEVEKDKPNDNVGGISDNGGGNSTDDSGSTIGGGDSPLDNDGGNTSDNNHNGNNHNSEDTSNGDKTVDNSEEIANSTSETDIDSEFVNEAGKAVDGAVLVQTGYRFDTKMLLYLGSIFCIVGLYTLARKGTNNLCKKC
jgi:hypothetical protein